MRRRGGPEEMSNHPFRSLFDLMVALVFILIGALVLQNGNTYKHTPHQNESQNGNTYNATTLMNELHVLHNMQIKEYAKKHKLKNVHYFTSLSELPKGDPCRAILRNGGRLNEEEWKLLQAHRTQMWQKLLPYFHHILYSKITNIIPQGKLQFASGSAVPIYPSQIQPILQDAYQKCLKGFTSIRVEGNTDNIPISNRMYPSNWELSAARAIWVAKQIQAYLTSKGVSIGKKGVFIEAIGFGDSKPIVPNTSDANRAKNRRIEIVYEKN
jgi:outer membrane protein OmpA-like peptidoglycan-associated protein